jgi:hypothetical protein
MYNEDVIQAIRDGQSRPMYLRILTCIASEALHLEAPIGQKAWRKKLMDVSPGSSSSISAMLRQAFDGGLLTGTRTTVKPLTESQFHEWQLLISTGTRTISTQLEELLGSEFIDDDSRAAIKGDLEGYFE